MSRIRNGWNEIGWMVSRFQVLVLAAFTGSDGTGKINLNTSGTLVLFTSEATKALISPLMSPCFLKLYCLAIGFIIKPNQYHPDEN